jgi:hypothetical protein
MATKYTKWLQNIPNSYKIYQMDIKHTTNSIAWPSKNYPKWDFGFETIPSGNPVNDRANSQFLLFVKKRRKPFLHIFLEKKSFNFKLSEKMPFSDVRRDLLSPRRSSADFEPFLAATFSCKWETVWPDWTKIRRLGNFHQNLATKGSFRRHLSLCYCVLFQEKTTFGGFIK